MEIQWEYKGEAIDSLPDKVYGFCYIIEYKDGTYYVGKKQIFQTKTSKPLKSGKNREGGTFFNKIVNHKITKFESITTENDWRKYIGSSKKTKSLNIKKKTILQVYADSINLTFGEIEYMVKLDVLRNDMYHNDNIAGKFFSSKIKKEII